MFDSNGPVRPGAHGGDGAAADPERVSLRIEAAPPPVVAPPPGHPRFPLLDSLRAIAALGVLVGHAAFLSGAAQRHWWGAATANGNLGVAVFFVLSGFLLYRPLINAQLNGAPRTRLRDYTRRRLLRIVPAYWVALTVLAIWPGLGPDFGGNWWRYYFFLQLYNRYTILLGIPQAWTLCVEVSFYFVLPLYAVALGHLTRGCDVRRRLAMEAGILLLLSTASIALRYSWLEHQSIWSNTLPAIFDWFALGMGLALMSAAEQGGWSAPRAIRALTARPVVCWGAAASTFLGVCLLFPNKTGFGSTVGREMFAHHLLGGVVALFLVLPAVFDPGDRGWPRRLLAWPVLGWLGLISYGIYLWQALGPALHAHGIGQRPTTLSFVALLSAMFAVSVACATISYYAVESPILRLKDRRGRRQHIGRAPGAIGHR